MNSTQAIADAVRAAQTLIPIGGGTKAALAACDASVLRLDMRLLSGIVSYEPSEYLISALSGTPIAQLQTALAERRQFLPFDPMFVSQGATLGGTIASGLSGSNRLLYGSLRDFVMEVEMVDGLGKLVRGGGKVVKNAAGFDLPKLMVGSYGRLGVLTEITLKVFPEPQATVTLSAGFANMDACILAVQKLLAQPLPIAALDIDSGSSVKLVVRFAGPASALPSVLTRATEILGNSILGNSVQSLCEADVEREFWLSRSHALVQVDGFLIRIATSLEGLATLVPELQKFSGASFCHTAAGSTTWLMLPGNADLESEGRMLAKLGLSAVAVLGRCQQLQAMGKDSWRKAAQRIQYAIDPHGKFVVF